MQMRASIIAVLVLASGCGNKQPKVVEKDADVKSAVKFLDALLARSSAVGPDDLDREVRRFREDADRQCSLVALFDDKIVVRDAKLLETYLRRCNRDVHVAALTMVVNAAEAARKATPVGVLKECSNAGAIVASE
jgi:hypothetical protein